MTLEELVPSEDDEGASLEEGSEEDTIDELDGSEEEDALDASAELEACAEDAPWDEETPPSDEDWPSELVAAAEEAGAAEDEASDEVAEEATELLERAVMVDEETCALDARALLPVADDEEPADETAEDEELSVPPELEVLEVLEEVCVQAARARRRTAEEWRMETDA